MMNHEEPAGPGPYPLRVPTSRWARLIQDLVDRLNAVNDAFPLKAIIASGPEDLEEEGLRFMEVHTPSVGKLKHFIELYNQMRDDCSEECDAKTRDALDRLLSGADATKPVEVQRTVREVEQDPRRRAYFDAAPLPTTQPVQPVRATLRETPPSPPPAPRPAPGPSPQRFVEDGEGIEF
jgi:hypothetical protein